MKVKRMSIHPGDWEQMGGDEHAIKVIHPNGLTVLIKQDAPDAFYFQFTHTSGHDVVRIVPQAANAFYVEGSN